MAEEPFSKSLERWLRSRKPKTLMGLSEVFGEKSFAIIFLILMFLPALPLPTGGISHVLEIITMLLALELIVGRNTIWLPKRWQHVTVKRLVGGKSLPFIIRRIRWLEKYTRPRLQPWFDAPFFTRGFGLIVFVFALAAFLAPPFSGLDTIPSMGVVVLSLGLITRDGFFLILGTILGAIGVGLEITLGAAVTKGIQHLFDLKQ